MTSGLRSAGRLPNGLTRTYIRFVALRWEVRNKNARGYDDAGDEVASIRWNQGLKGYWRDHWVATLWFHAYPVQGEWDRMDEAILAAEAAYERGEGREPPAPPMSGRKLG